MYLEVGTRLDRIFFCSEIGVLG